MIIVIDVRAVVAARTCDEAGIAGFCSCIGNLEDTPLKPDTKVGRHARWHSENVVVNVQLLHATLMIVCM